MFIKIKEIGLVFLVILLSGNIFANKPVVGIGEITSSVGGNPVSFQTMLETAISQTNKFELMERSRMDDVLGEQALSAGGLTQGNGQIGGLSGVDYLVYGSITKLGTKSDAVAFGGMAAGGQKAEMSVDIRVVDSSTGAIRISKTVQKQASSGGGFAMEGLAMGNEEADPLGEVQRLTANAVASLIAMEIFPIKVINVSKGQAYVNYGPPSVTKGMFLQIIELGEGFMDPDTGEMLGQDETYLGSVKITDVKSKFSIGTILEGDIQRGAIASKLDKKKGKKIENKYKKKCKKQKNCLALK
ncbi:CsgG/HfaB family protein [Gammaproteobacteria bacterium]|nr:CsgG/HfaB family protein [Gammaproteobacteria bacterium]